MLIKGDSSFAIHQNKLLRPTNYMMGATLSVSLDEENNTILVDASKRKPKEQIKTTFYRVDFVESFEMDEGKNDISLFGSERELSNELMQDLSFLEKGLKPLNQEEVFRKGIVDILAEDAKGNLVIVEVKRRQAGYDAVEQLKRYVIQVERLKGKHPRGLLVAPAIGKNAMELLERYGLEFFSFDFEIGNPKAKIKGLQKKQKTLFEALEG